MRGFGRVGGSRGQGMVSDFNLLERLGVWG